MRYREKDKLEIVIDIVIDEDRNGGEGGLEIGIETKVISQMLIKDVDSNKTEIQKIWSR